MKMKICIKTSSRLPAFNFTNPLLSSVVTLYALILLYFPHKFLRIILSPVPIITGILLFSLLRLGATQKCGDENRKSDKKALRSVVGEAENCREERKEIPKSGEPDQKILGWPEEDHGWVDDYESETDSEPEAAPRFEDSFMGWDLGAPLEVIYEEEDEEEEEEAREVVGIQTFVSCARCFPESEGSENSDEGGEFPPSPTGFWYSPESLGFTWEEEEDREELIEIALDGNKKKKKSELDYFQVEEDNLIEIDLSLPINDFPAKNMCPPASQVLLT